MKRADLEVGMEVATKRGWRAVVVATEPWDESRQYLVRFGTAGTARFYPVTDGPGRGYSTNKSGVAVATLSGHSGPERTPQWGPGVVQLGQITGTWEAHQAAEAAQRQARGVRELALRDREAARVETFARIPEVLKPRPVLSFDHHYSSTEVAVNLGVLLEYLEGRRAL